MSEELENAEENEAEVNEGSSFERVGDRLAAERREQGIDLTTIAERTRVPLRHLEAIEKSDFASLPGSTYTLGFARSYARVLEMDAASVGSDLRSELSESGNDGYQVPSQNYEPADPSRVPPRALAWTAAGIAAVLLIGYLVWRSIAFDGGGGSDPLVAQQEDVDKEATAAPLEIVADPSGDVVLTANDTVWVRVYDAENKRLFEKEMQTGDSYNVPSDANGPMINTGRAQAIDVTIGGKKVDPLGPADLPILDIGVSASVLLNRGKTADESDKVDASAQE